MKIQTKATGVLERTSHYLKSGLLREKPVWYNVVGANPPNTDLTKRARRETTEEADPGSGLFQKNGKLFKTRVSGKERVQSNNAVHRVPKIALVEDELRDVFYNQHPWELLRPKTLVENSGDDYRHCDWLHILQLHRPLDGELVVQRTMWLLENKQKDTVFDAYDQARFEFYRLRMAEEMEATVAREEASMYGAIYPLTNVDWGIKKEQEHIDMWTRVAGEKTKVKAASKDGRLNGSMGTDNVVEAKESIWETEFEEAK